MKVVPRRANSPERLVMVKVALEALDRAEEARLVLAAEGITARTESTGAVHAHPALKVERENRQLFARIWKELDLDWSAELDGCGLQPWH